MWRLRADAVLRTGVPLSTPGLVHINAGIAGRLRKTRLRRRHAVGRLVRLQRGLRAADALDSIAAQLATKADADALDSVRAEMATKEDLRREIAASEARMEQRLQNAILEAKVSLIKWMIATMAVFSGVVIGAVAALQ